MFEAIDEMFTEAFEDLQLIHPAEYSEKNSFHSKYDKLGHAFEDLVLLGEGSLSLSMEDFALSEVTDLVRDRVNKINYKLQKYGERLDLQVVSQEGIFGLIGSGIKAIFKFFKSLLRWIGETIRSAFGWYGRATKVSKTMDKSNQERYNKVQSALKSGQARRGTPEEVTAQRAQPNPAPKEQVIVPEKIVVLAPYSSYTVFHTSNFVPKPGFEFNAQNVLKAMTILEDNSRRFVSAVNAQLDILIPLSNEIVDAISAGKQIKNEMVYRAKQRGQLGQLADTNFSFMGFRVVNADIPDTNEFRQSLITIESVIADNGWRGEDKFEITIPLEEVANVSAAIAKRIELNERSVEAVLGRLNREGLFRKLNTWKEPSFMHDETGAVNEFKQWNIRKINDVFQIVQSIQRLAEKHDTFVRNHTQHLTAIMYNINKQLTA